MWDEPWFHRLDRLAGYDDGDEEDVDLVMSGGQNKELPAQGAAVVT